MSEAASDPVEPPHPVSGGRAYLISRFAWSLGNFAASFGLRLLSNVVLTRLLAPEVFGIMVVVSAIRLGVELLSDVGIEQNIVRHPDGLTPRFLNTAWTMQVMRGALLSLLFIGASPLLARFYDLPVAIFAVMGIAPLLNALHSTAIFGLVKRMEVKQRTLFEFRAELVGFAASVLLALIIGSVWALVAGTLIGIAARSALSYRLPHPPHRLLLDRAIAKDILRFGRWIMVSSVLMFAAGNLDRLTLGRVAPLAMLGIYGLARTVADIPALMARRLSYQIVFPLLSGAEASGDTAISARLRPLRLRLVLLAGAGIGVAAASGDWAVAILYDARYAQAGWMVSLLLAATFWSILSNLNEGLLLGAGRPAFETGGNLVRIVTLAAGLWVGYQALGFAGAIGAIIAGEIGRYAFVAIGQHRARLSFFRQDVLALAALVVSAAAWLWLRLLLGLGAPWDTLETLR